MNDNTIINLLEFESIIDTFKDIKGPLIPILHEAQNLYGYIPISIQNLISDKLKISNSEINGVASFYSMFYTKPTGKHHIGICTGTTCHFNGSGALLKQLEQSLGIKEGETTSDGQFTIVPVKCIGNCDQAPNITIDGEVHSSVDIKQLNKILNLYSDK